MINLTGGPNDPVIVLNKHQAHLASEFEACGITVVYDRPMPTLEQIFSAGHENRLARMKRKAGYEDPLV